MSIFLGSTEPNKIFVGGSEVASVWAGNTKIRPIIKTVYIDFLLVGGGGGGGQSYNGVYTIPGAGGGAGGFVSCCNYEILKGSYPITIGAGGACHVSPDVGKPGENGGDSCFNDVVAYGGGGGGAINGYNGKNGGSGGGAAANYTPGYGCSGQGCNGGTGLWEGSIRSAGSGGGGGAGGVGCNAQGVGGAGGAGGAGVQNNFSGTNVTYSCGGGGGTSSCGDANKYGGGGGANGAGCQGIFIARYPTSSGYNMTGGCKYTCGSYTIHCFTSDGTLIIN